MNRIPIFLLTLVVSMAGVRAQQIETAIGGLAQEGKPKPMLITNAPMTGTFFLLQGKKKSSLPLQPTV